MTSYFADHLSSSGGDESKKIDSSVAAKLPVQQSVKDIASEMYGQDHLSLSSEEEVQRELAKEMEKANEKRKEPNGEAKNKLSGGDRKRDRSREERSHDGEKSRDGKRDKERSREDKSTDGERALRESRKDRSKEEKSNDSTLRDSRKGRLRENGERSSPSLRDRRVEKSREDKSSEDKKEKAGGSTSTNVSPTSSDVKLGDSSQKADLSYSWAKNKHKNRSKSGPVKLEHNKVQKLQTERDMYGADHLSSSDDAKNKKIEHNHNADHTNAATTTATSTVDAEPPQIKIDAISSSGSSHRSKSKSSISKNVSQKTTSKKSLSTKDSYRANLRGSLARKSNTLRSGPSVTGGMSSKDTASGNLSIASFALFSGILEQYTQLDEEKNWNAELNRLLMLKESKEKYEAIANLVNDFTYTARLYSHLIVSELYMKDKKIPPLGIGGVAGGNKYKVHGILFKFALDGENGMYGSDENAMKVAAHEWRGLNCFFCAQSEDHFTKPKVNLPLMCLVDFRGFRLVAMSVVPISSKTLVYGSDDGGKTVLCDDEFHKLMKKAARVMNIKGHACGAEKTMIYGPTDIEGHRGLDGELYLVDFARTLPAQYRLKEYKDEKSCRHLYEMLRPELVQNYEVPLNPDAFSMFLKYDPDRHQSLVEVTQATNSLLRVQIPSVAKYLNQLAAEKVNIKIQDVKYTLHSFGVNIRFLGMVRKQGLASKVDSLLLNEMVARVLKNTIKNSWRQLMAKIKIPADGPYKAVVLHTVNRIFESGPNRDAFWKSDIKNSLSTKYIYSLTEAELHPDYDLSRHISVKQIFERLKEMLGIRLNPETPISLLATGNFTLVRTDIDSFVDTYREPPILSQALATQLHFTLPTVFGNEVIRLFNMAQEKWKETTYANPTNAKAFMMWGSMLLDCARRSEFRNINIHTYLLREAVEKLHKAISLNGSLNNCYFLLVVCFTEILTTVKFLREESTPEVKGIVTKYMDEGKWNLEWVFKKSKTEYAEKLSKYIATADHNTLFILSSMRILSPTFESVMQSRISTLTEITCTPNASIPIRMFVLFLRKLPLLEKLTLSQTNLNLDFELLSDAIPNCSHLSFVHVDMVDCRFSEHLLRKLRRLNLNSCDTIDDKVIASLVYCHSDLEHLSLSGCTLITKNSISLLASGAMKCMQTLEVGQFVYEPAHTIRHCYSLKSVPFLISFPALVRLDISYTPADDVFLSCISTILTLNYLDIQYCKNITDVGIEHLGKNCGNLQHLFIKESPKLTTRSVEYIMQIKFLKTLHFKSVMCLQGLYALIMELKYLDTLDLSDWLTQKSGEYLMEEAFLKTVPNATLFGSQGGSLKEGKSPRKRPSSLVIVPVNKTREMFNMKTSTNRGPSSSKLPLPVSLQTLVISEIGDRADALMHLNLCGWSMLADQALQVICAQFRLLQTINLSGCIKLTDDALEMLQPLIHLRDLNLSHCLFSNVGIKNLLTYVNTSIEILCLDGCERITDDSLNRISKYVYKLKNLSLVMCQNITLRGVQELLLQMNTYRHDLNVLDLRKNNITEKQTSAMRHTHPDLKIYVDQPNVVVNDSSLLKTLENITFLKPF